ncbi:MAG: hypothetical protein AAGF12_40540 [Myxococcota bacterium]
MDRVRKCWIPVDLGLEDAAAVLDVPREREGHGKAVLSGASHADW